MAARAANQELSSKKKLLAFLKAEHGMKLKESKAALATNKSNNVAEIVAS